MKLQMIEADEEEVHVCAECYFEIQYLKSGDEQWSFCENCQMAEGNTTYVKQSEVEPK